MDSSWATRLHMWPRTLFWLFVSPVHLAGTDDIGPVTAELVNATFYTLMPMVVAGKRQGPIAGDSADWPRRRLNARNGATNRLSCDFSPSYSR